MSAAAPVAMSAAMVTARSAPPPTPPPPAAPPPPPPLPATPPPPAPPLPPMASGLARVHADKTRARPRTKRMRPPKLAGVGGTDVILRQLHDWAAALIAAQLGAVVERVAHRRADAGAGRIARRARVVHAAVYGDARRAVFGAVAAHEDGMAAAGAARVGRAVRAVVAEA